METFTDHVISKTTSLHESKLNTIIKPCCSLASVLFVFHLPSFFLSLYFQTIKTKLPNSSTSIMQEKIKNNHKQSSYPQNNVTIA